MSRPLFSRIALAVAAALVATTLAPGLAQGAPDPAGSPSIVDVLGKGGGNGQYLTAKDGRQVILRGLNTQGSVKMAPDCMPAYGPKEIARERTQLRSNAVRLLLQWRCVEPQPNVYDDAYLDRVAALVKTYNDHGMTVLFDMHQDLWGPGITPERNVGNGAPVWATHTDGLPVKKNKSWAMYYLEPGVTRAFDNFWNKFGNHPELMDHYARMWGHVAKRFASNPGVFGYDLMNEPYMGSALPSTIESGPLAELYRKSVTEIRKADADTWIFLAPIALGSNQGFGTNLPHIPDPRKGSPRIGYAPHLYILGTEEGGMKPVLSPAIKAGINMWQAKVRQQARTLSPDGTTVPILVGEYGLDTTKSGALDYIAYAQARFAEMGSSVFYYSSDSGDWGPWDEAGKPRNTRDALAVCYAAVVSGFMTSQSTRPDGCTLEFERSEGGETQVYVPWASKAGDVAVQGAEVLGFHADQQLLLIKVPAGAKTSVKVTKA